ncbi:Fes1 domain-containing protein [Mycena indigotica]|uniref:Fes1 domain-containing protein n=1 Tax=Mycena indigotica TaxID=2126181 RepID=A0A8H6SII7_9AGAR|nr:Fes1 domain-containing protein [Mycena indigotica]KAF7299291.1 Fes1 domain-containing protein [Mycena indigotica]
MESLLRWSIENSTPRDPNVPLEPPRQPPQALDPGIIDHILGKSDAVLMKEDMAAAVDETKDEEERIAALDHLEMLIEQIDNANNLEKLKLWTPLQQLITSAPSNALRMQALWVAGTALQNNPAAQDAYLELDPLPSLTQFLLPSSASTAQTRSKAVYTLSGLLKHNAPAVVGLSRNDVQGWERLREALQDPDLGVRRKALFLISTLLIPNSLVNSSGTSSGVRPRDADPVHPNSHAAALRTPSRVDTAVPTLDALHTHGILDAVVHGLTKPVPSGPDGDVLGLDADFEEKGIGLLRTFALTHDGTFSAAQKVALKPWIAFEHAKDPSGTLERWGLTQKEIEGLVSKVNT